jgi:hypothetical protein
MAALGSGQGLFLSAATGISQRFQGLQVSETRQPKPKTDACGRALK